jgi:conjugal transfer pilus assembly protein TraE
MEPSSTEKTKRIFSQYLQKSSNVFAENKTLRFMFAGILAVVLMNTVSIQRIKDHTKTILIPMGYSVEYEFTGSTPSDNYLRDIGLFIIQMAGDISANNAEAQFEDILAIWHPTTATEYRKRFMTIAEELRKYPSTSYDVLWNASQPITFKTGEIRIQAAKKKIVGETVTATTTLEYKIEYTMESGRFSIVHLKEIGGEDI